MPNEVAERVEAFLKTRLHSDGGSYAEVPEHDWHELHQIILDIIDAKWDRDGDGDVPISFQLVDRTRYYMPTTRLIPHSRWSDTDEDLLHNMEALEVASSNAECHASSAYGIAKTVRGLLERRQKAKGV